MSSDSVIELMKAQTSLFESHSELIRQLQLKVYQLELQIRQLLGVA